MSSSVVSVPERRAGRSQVIFEIGEDVLCRDAGTEFRRGEVTNVNPLEVMRHSWDKGCQWDEVKKFNENEVHEDFMDRAVSPLEFGALGKLGAWKSDAHSLEDVMEVVRWVESKLNPPPPPPRMSPRRAWALLLVLAVCVVLAACGFTTLAAFMAKPTVVDESANVLSVSEGDDIAAGASEAVRLRSLLTYEELGDEELRLAKDIVLRHAGVFHFYRVASVARLGRVNVTAADGRSWQWQRGGVSVIAEDGTSIRVAHAHVSLQRPWEPTFDADMVGHIKYSDDSDVQWAHHGAFKVVAVSPGSGGR